MVRVVPIESFQTLSSHKSSDDICGPGWLGTSPLPRKIKMSSFFAGKNFKSAHYTKKNVEIQLKKKNIKIITSKDASRRDESRFAWPFFVKSPPARAAAGFVRGSKSAL